MANKKDEASSGILIIVVMILFISIAPAILATYLYHRNYKQLPDTPRKRLAFIYAITSCISLYIAAAIISPIFFSWIFGRFLRWDYVVGDSWLISSLLVLCITLPTWIAYAYQIKKIRSESGDATSYIEELEAMLNDKKFDDEKIEHLKNLIGKYKIPPATLNKVHKDAFISTFMNCVTDDCVISSSEKKYLQIIAKYLNIDQDVIDYANQIIEQTKSIKKIIDGKEKGIITTDFIPQKNERCIMLENCTLYENVKKGIYIGTSLGLREILPLGQLLNPRFYLGKRIDYQQFTKVDNGKIALTTKRVVFIGESTTRAFKLNDIIGLDIGIDGFQVNRQGKVKKEVFKMSPDMIKIFIGALLLVIR